MADDELEVTIDADEPALELIADGEIIDRIGPDHSNVSIGDVSLTNQILEIRLARSGNSKATNGLLTA